MNEVLTKPIEAMKLKETLSAAVGARRARL
jgi:hypothetical protein